MRERNRKPNRLKGYDYSRTGYYFVTVCAQDRQCLFGEIDAGRMVLNRAGQMVDRWWRKTESKFPHVELGEYVLMPNHIHGVVAIAGAVGTGPRACPDARARPEKEQPSSDKGQPRGAGQPQGVVPTLSLSDIVHRFKSLATHKYIAGVRNDGWEPFEGALWQRSFHDRVIRDDEDLNRIREYIRENPARWAADEENPENRVAGVLWVRGGHRMTGKR